MNESETGQPILASTRGQHHLPRWFGITFEVLQGIKSGSVDLVLPDGRIFRVAAPAPAHAPGPAARLEVIDTRLFARIAREGELGFCEAYMEGWWTTPDLQALLDVLLSNRGWVRRAHPVATLLRNGERLLHWLNRNTPRQARRNIAHHYDLGNRFYGQWLDETMTYSSALFADPGTEPLAAAQIRKYESIFDRIGPGTDPHLLEIGCGWGGFAEYAARIRGARLTALTISRAQHDFARRRIFEAGLAERVDVQLRDYRDERGRYDGIASIEMFEAVGEAYWPVYFETIRERLAPGARATIQVITIAEPLFPTYRRTVDFIQKYIFPGGMLPSPGALRHEIERAGLGFVGSLEFGASYSETLRRWHTAFNAAWSEIEPLGFDERFRRMWTLYLTSCAAAFLTGTTDVAQVTMQRPG